MPFPHPRQIIRKKQGFCAFPRYPAHLRSDSGGILRRFGVSFILGRFRYDAIHNGETFGGFWALFSVFGCLAIIGGDEGRGDVEEVKGVSLPICFISALPPSGDGTAACRLLGVRTN